MSETRPECAHLSSTKPSQDHPRKSREMCRNHPGYCHAASLFPLLQLPLLQNPSKRLRHHAGERVLPLKYHIVASVRLREQYPTREMKRVLRRHWITRPTPPTIPRPVAGRSAPLHPASPAGKRVSSEPGAGHCAAYGVEAYVLRVASSSQDSPVRAVSCRELSPATDVAPSPARSSAF
jgi:hypothetical protein